MLKCIKAYLLQTFMMFVYHFRSNVRHLNIQIQIQMQIQIVYPH